MKQSIHYIPWLFILFINFWLIILGDIYKTKVISVINWDYDVEKKTLLEQLTIQKEKNAVKPDTVFLFLSLVLLTPPIKDAVVSSRAAEAAGTCFLLPPAAFFLPFPASSFLFLPPSAPSYLLLPPSACSNTQWK